MTDSARPVSGRKVSRRTFLSGLGLFIAGAAAASLPGIDSHISHDTQGPGSRWVTLGPLSGLVPGVPAGYPYARKLKDGWADALQTGIAYAVADIGSRARVLANVCTNDGCRVTWQPDRGVFVCPLCGGLYDAGGQVLAGPPKKALEQLACRVNDSQVQVLLEV